MVGVGALIFDQRRRERVVLLAERAGKPLQGYWSLPGGLVETGELLEEAVCREVLEETGLKVKATKQFEIFERIMRDAQGRVEYHFVLADYVCKVVGGKLGASSDASRLAWVRLKDLGDYLLTEGTREVIERAFRDARRKRT